MQSDLILAMISSRHLFQDFVNFSSFGRSVIPKHALKFFANTGPRRILWQHHLSFSFFITINLLDRLFKLTKL